ncbi:hypothetical protein BV210_18650 (plasmid) [Halorientalis sp. IM1011]|uniref:helix-turn-helix domain-containing protein n=1 Tax=Halorientalis sp. IM1011 TaxID=1932360 RepID=UPI00097CC69D|nr:helix-turn-helix domain-containing protein [Halorientalis sp. IM1011]AQL44769.1 hypothetical protein BV210_18650 [Halorientalis sp. IM1011]
MVYVAEFTIPPSSFPFGKTLIEMPDIEIQIDEIVPTDESALPFFWVRGCDPDEFMEYAEREPEVKDTREIETSGNVALFRAKWTPNAAVVEGLKELDITIVEALGTTNHWEFEVRAEEQDSLTRFQEVFEAEGIPISLSRLYSLEDLIDGEHRELTQNQRDALLIAYEEGYFDKPRTTTQDELSEQFGISRRAFSERLRRGTRNLIEDALLPDTGT